MSSASKRLAWIVTSAGLAAGAALAQDLPKAPPPGLPSQPAAVNPTAPVDENAPRIEFNETTHEFGVISDEKEVSTEFKFTNKGKSKLIIADVKGSCGCTVPNLEKKEYEPGESGQIRVIYNPHNRRGKQHTNVTVNSNDPSKSQVVLSVQSEIKPTIMTDPQVAAMGQVERGKPGKATITITSRKLDLLPTQVTPNDAKINAVIGEKKEIVQDGEKMISVPIEISLSPTAEIGPIQTQCTVRTSDPNKTLNFMVLGEVVGQIKAEPARVTLGGVAPGQDINQTFRISPRGDKSFKVLSIEEQPASVPSASNPQGAPGAKVFTIKYTEDKTVTPNAWIVSLTGKAPDDNTTTFRGDLLVKTDMPGEETFKVPYYGFIRQKPKPVAGQQNPAGQPNPSMLVPDR
ncbi:MAG: DUF1573 domain-containing protein [Phycisphaerae bacterium]|nr:DUF1573 domain-containing protein [Phycisphaerae bacterium]